MSDLAIQPVQNYGQLLSSYGEGVADETNASTNQLAALSSIPNKRADAAEAQARTGLITTQTQGADIQNQNAAIQQQALKNYMQSMQAPSDASAGAGPAALGQDTSQVTGLPGTGASAGGGQQPPTTDDGSSPSPSPDWHDDSTASDKMDAAMASKYQVNKAFTPGEQRRMAAALQYSAVSGDPRYTEAAAKLHDLRVLNQTAASQQEAQRHYNSSYTVATAPDGRAFTVMSAIDPNFANHAARVEGADPSHPEKWTAEQKADVDSNIRKFATIANEKLFQYTGDTLESKDGKLVNSRTGMAPIGGQTQGLTPEQRSGLVKDGQELVSVPDGKGGSFQEERWKAVNASSLDSYVRDRATAAGANVPSPERTQAARTANTGRTQGATNDDGTALSAVQRSVTDPTLRSALSDSSYRAPNYSGGIGHTPDPGTADLIKAQSDARIGLLKDSNEAIARSGQAQQMLTAAQAILDSKQAPTQGQWGALKARFGQWWPGGTENTTNYQEAAKLLANSAIQAGQGNFSRGLTDKDTSLQLSKLSPSLDMTSDAARSIIKTNLANLQYDVDSARRVPVYLSAGNDPMRYNDFNSAFFNRGKIVNQAAAAPGTPAVGTVRGGYRFKGGDPSQQANWMKQ